MTMFVTFGHRKRVGKDTAGRLLRSHLRLHKKGSDVQTHGFADKLKNVTHDIYGWAGLQSKDYYDDHPEEREIVLPKLGMSPREIWIKFATLVAREVYPTTWIDYVLNTVFCDVCIITDLRFPNEADLIHDAGGVVYKIERDGGNRSEEAIEEGVNDIADDPMEGYNGWDAVITNNGSLKEFNDKIVKIAEAIILQIKD
jgi:hypothetical protein